MALDYDAARGMLEARFAVVEAIVLSGTDRPDATAQIASDCDRLFASETQAYREVLVGCLLARLLDKSINIRHPYINLGPSAFNGRTLDERVINPFLHDRRIPSSRGPYLSVFRRSVTLEPRGGLRDVQGYEAFLRLIAIAESTKQDSQIGSLLDQLLFRFVHLREETSVPLNRLHRFSLEQYGALVNCLLGSPSGGRFPLFVTVSVLRALNHRFNLDWDIAYQGINVADRASGAAGDVTVTRGGVAVISAEITERRVDRSRVVSTFNAKIAPAAAKDYLFFVTNDPADDAREQAHRYFAQGHDINFVNISQWTGMILATLGQAGREQFNTEILSLLDSAGVPKALKVAWNSCADSVIQSI